MIDDIQFVLKGEKVNVTVDSDRFLITVLRREFGLTGTKYGCGEPACTTLGAVLNNAVCDALGVRLYELPITPAPIKRALEGKT